MDDNSTDNTRLVVEQLGREDRRIKLIRKSKDSPKGPCASRNIGIQASQGEFFVFLDSDDILLPSCLETRLEFMADNPSLDFAVFPQSTFQCDISEPGWLINIKTQEEIMDRFLRFGKDIDVPWLNTAPIWRKKFLTRHSLMWDENLICYDDLFFHIEALANNPIYAIVDSLPDCRYRMHQGDRVGQLVHDPVNMTLMAEHFLNLFSLLCECNCIDERRKKLFLQSIYFVVILKQIDFELFDEAEKVIRLLKTNGLVDWKIENVLGVYVRLRKTFVAYPRLRFYTNKIFSAATEKSIYMSNPSNYLAHRYEI